MDFLDPKKKRASTLRLYIGYVLMTVLIGIASFILAFRASGFNLDPKTGDVIQNGLIFIAAQPEAAEIYIDGELYRSQTDARIELPAGQYEIELRRTGYRSWSRIVNIEGGKVERLVYPLLFPENITSDEINLYGSLPSLSLQSPDRRWLMIQQNGQFNKFDRYDLNTSDQANSLVEFPINLFGKGNNHQIKLVEWSADNRHVLIEHLFDGKNEFLVLDRQDPTASININQNLKVTPTSASLRDKRYDQLYLFTAAGGLLQSADTRSGQVVEIETDVVAYKSHGDDVLLYAVPNKEIADSISVIMREGNISYRVRELPANTTYLLDIARFDNSWYVVAGTVKEGKVFVYKNPTSFLRKQPNLLPAPITVLRLDNPSDLSIAANARMIGLQAGQKIAVYDIENDLRFDYEIEHPLDGRMKWMDGNRWVGTTEGKVIVFDFDGTNLQLLSDVSAGSLPIFDREYDRLYTLAPSKVAQGRFSFNRTQLRL